MKTAFTVYFLYMKLQFSMRTGACRFETEKGIQGFWKSVFKSILLAGKQRIYAITSLTLAWFTIWSRSYEGKRLFVWWIPVTIEQTRPQLCPLQRVFKNAISDKGEAHLACHTCSRNKFLEKQPAEAGSLMICKALKPYLNFKKNGKPIWLSKQTYIKLVFYKSKELLERFESVPSWNVVTVIPFCKLGHDVKVKIALYGTKCIVRFADYTHINSYLFNCRQYKKDLHF